MATFFDDFERANGALGGSWASCNGSLTITGGTAGGDGFNRAMCNTTLSDSSRILAKCHIFYQNSASYAQGPAVKMASAANFCFAARIVLVSSAPTLQIVSIAGTTATILASLTLGYTPPPYCELSLEWNLGHLTAMVDGAHTLGVDNAGGVGANYAGIYSNITQAGVADCRIVGGTDPSLSVSPLVIGNYGACSTVTLTGSNTAWTPGTPGSPTFTVNHGSISAQTVIDAGTATLTYCPDTYLGAVVFTDPSTGVTAGAVVTSDPAVVPPGTSYLFTPQAVAMVNNTAGDSYIERLLKPNTSVDVEGVASLELDTVLGKVALNTGATVTPTSLPSATLLYTLYRLMNGGYPSAIGPFTSPTYDTLDAGLTDHRDRLDALITSNHWTLGDVITQLAGEGVKTHLDLYNAIDAISGGSNAEVLDAIAGAKGDPLATVKAVLDALYVLGGTTNGYTLATVKTWVEAVRGSGLPTVKGVMDKLGGSSNTIETRIDALSDLIVTETTLQSIIDIAAGVLSGRAGATIGSVLDAIDALPAPTSSGRLAAPVWPGDGLATLATSHDLADGLIVDGPMHGLIVTIDGHPNGAGKYAFGSVMSWQHCGAVVFRDDAGHYERAESFGLPSQIITPRSMAEAATATVRLNGGWSGTIRGWTVTP